MMEQWDELPPLTERERVEAWRLSVLVEAGYSAEIAASLAVSDVDLHRAVEMVAAGCKPLLAAAILL